jgi:DNA-directed RNA polymerase subunit RPC12/RpoP
MICVNCGKETPVKDIEGFIVYDCVHCGVSVFDIQADS